MLLINNIDVACTKLLRNLDKSNFFLILRLVKFLYNFIDILSSVDSVVVRASIIKGFEPRFNSCLDHFILHFFQNLLNNF